MSTEGRQIIVASNRGPGSFGRDASGRVVPGRGAGGLVTALSGALAATGGQWIAAAMSAEDRAHAGIPLDVEAGQAGYRVRLLAFDPATYERFYDGVSNRILWFLHHRLWDVPREPTFEGLAEAWAGYRSVNDAFAQALVEHGSSDT